MKNRSCLTAWLCLLVVATALAGCGPGKLESAQSAIAQTQAALADAGPEAIKYVPGEVKTVKAQISELQSLFDQKDFDGVLAAAPQVLEAAQALPGRAAAAREALIAELKSDWASLSESAPSALAAVQSRVDILSQATRLPHGMDSEQLEQVSDGLDKAQDLWNKAVVAYNSGDLEAAVALGRGADNRASELLEILGMSPG